ncbi:hypothetical protein GHT06_013447 [Daphnia sinensis]|uniref:Uncharacterized protein n=1 Tax=Daphnia sinensis TaxID=1820382 RepID=A0AAD5PU58_9CRUS|nr:hypothetical protein GHT06_013447 [Daphnia sinensis]
MSLERPHSRASSGTRGPPPTPPPTYLWEEVRRSKCRGGYPWTILYKPPLPDSLDIESLLKGEVPNDKLVDEQFKGDSAYGTSRRTQIRNRLRDRERNRRARSEPTPSLQSSNSVSLSETMDQAMAVDSSGQPEELEDFPLPDEDIPDFVMAYLQSDKGNLDEDIPDHILEYIQSRAAILERNQLQPKPTDDIFYTQDELRIIDEARKRLEEQGELDVDPSATIDDDMNAFDHFFQRTTGAQEALAPSQEKSNGTEYKETRASNSAVAESENKKTKKGGKFNFSNMGMPNKPHLNIKLPKFGPGRKKVKGTSEADVEDQEPEAAEPNKKCKPRRPHSSSPMRQKINQQLESWNNSLKKFKASRSGRNNADGQIKSFVALLPGRSLKPTKPKQPENQYEEVGPPRADPAVPKTTDGDNPVPPTVPVNSGLKAAVESAEEVARLSPSQENNEAEETMDDIENLPESEEADLARDGIIVDREVADVIVTRGEFVDIDIDEDFEDDGEGVDGQTEIEQVPQDDKNVVAEPTGFAARSRKAFELTKSKIQTSLSKEQLQATRNKLQSTLSKQNLQATRQKVQSSLSKRNLQATREKLQSTLSKENFQATRDKLQTSLNSTLKRKKNKNVEPTVQPIPQDNIFPTFPQEAERDYETSTPVERKTKDAVRRKSMPDEEFVQDDNPPTVKQRTKKTIQSVEKPPVHSNQTNECENIEEETEEDLEEELEPKLEFSLHGSDRPQPSSVSQSTETLPEDDVESDKENVVVRPKRQRHRNRRHGFHEEFGRPKSAHVEFNTRSSWVEKTNAYPTISQEMLSAFCAPVNSLEAVDSSWGSGRKPDRPARSRSRKERDVSSDDHLYSNLPPRRSKRGQKKTCLEPSNEDNYVKTWPRKALSTDRPVVPKRAKSKVAKKPLFPVCSNYQTWPRRTMVHSPPTAPKRTRSKRQINCEGVSCIRDLEEQIEQPTHHILIDADTLFGAESRFIDEETETERSEAVNEQQPLTADDCKLKYEIPSESQLNTTQAKILNSNKSPKPSAPNRRKNNQTGSLRKAKHAVVASNYGETTWPRMSRTSQPSAPRRRKESAKKSGKAEATLHLDLEETSKKLPTVPASTPSEDHDTNEHGDVESASSVQADLDQILEILATTFPQEATPKEENTDNIKTDKPIGEPTTNPVHPNDSDDVLDENPYAEIKQFQKRTPPPRPPPPIYAPTSASSYSYIYTVPRRKKAISTSVSPERPPRTYCTIRPHRPPRKQRPRTPNEVDHSQPNLVRRHSFSGVDEAKDERNLQSAPVVERMRARPLPAPPRIKRHRSRSPPHKPPRSRTSSLKRHTPHQTTVPCATNEETAPLERAIVQPVSNVDEYEPIENPDQVEEISIGIQTDPLPEYEESVVMAEPNGAQLDATLSFSEINNNRYDHHEDVDPPDNERLVHRQDVTVSSPTVVQPTTNDHDEAPCPQIVWSSATSPDPDPVTLSVSEPVLLEESIPESKADSQPLGNQIPQNIDSMPRLDSSTSRKTSAHEREDETDSFSQVPPYFHRSLAPLPPLHIDFPTRLQLADLDVERLNVREVMADRLVVSSVDTNSLQVCQMTTSNATGQLMFNIGPGVTIPFLGNLREEPVAADRQMSQPPTPVIPSAEVPSIPETQLIVEREEKEPPIRSSLGELEARPPADIILPEQPIAETAAPPSSNTRIAVAPSIAELDTTNRTLGQTENTADASFSNLALQLVNVSARNLASGVCIAATETYTMAQRVAEIGLQQLNDHLQRRGIQFDDKEKEDLKAILLMLLIVVCAIFLLGMGKQRISNHWDFYFPN